MKKRNGFTLIELLAVIVILGVIMIIAIPSVTSYITNSRKDTTIDTAKSFINAVKTASVANSMAVGSTVDYALPTQTHGAIIVSIKNIELEKGGDKSAFGNDWDYDKSYVLVENTGTTEKPAYTYSIALLDAKGNGFKLTKESDLKRATVTTPASSDIIELSAENLDTAAEITTFNTLNSTTVTNFEYVKVAE